MYQAFRQPGFLVCAAGLSAAAVGMHAAAETASHWMHKRPIPIRKPMREFNAEALTGFRFVEDVGEGDAGEVETNEYLAWRLGPATLQAPAAATTFLQIYYYTSEEKTPQIPHTPEVCYRQGGNQVTDIGDLSIPIPGLAPGIDSVAAKYVRMSHPTQPQNRDFCVVYVFCVNGRFHDDREKARLDLAMPWNRAVYFAKIECATRIARPERLPEALDTCRSMLAAAIAELVRNHFPTQADVEAALR